MKKKIYDNEKRMKVILVSVEIKIKAIRRFISLQLEQIRREPST